LSSKAGIWLRKLGGVIFLFVVLALAFSFYFFKYVPARKTEFHRNAFLELKQIEYAFNTRNKSFAYSLQNFNLKDQKRFDIPSLKNYFLLSQESDSNNDRRRLKDSTVTVRPTSLQYDSTYGAWQLNYPFHANGHSYIAKKNFDSVFIPIISTYQDIFDGYVVILGKKDTGEIIYHSGNYAIDYTIVNDSLTKKRDGFSLQSVKDISIEGNPYKLFIDPVPIGTQTLILAGFISQSHYTAKYQETPFSFISIISVLALLLLIHLPILKIYLLNKNERLTDIDIRLIIGSFFIAAFVGFFLFTKILLDQDQPIHNRRNLTKLSLKMELAMKNEIDSMLLQLDSLEWILKSHYGTAALEGVMKEHYSKTFQLDSAKVKQTDFLLKPRVYPYMDQFFLLDKEGNWQGRWAFRKKYNFSPFINARDRQYFIDLKQDRELNVKDIHEKFTIQPTLAKLDGAYVGNVVKKCSNLWPDTVVYSKNRKALDTKFYVIGISSQMHSLYNTLLPPGYDFSIITENGDIQYDSKKGRGLLSNFYMEVGDSASVKQSVQYHAKHFFESMMVRGKKVALLSRPLEGFPYQLMVYCNLARSEGFQKHVIFMAALLTGIVVGLLIFSAFVNERAKKKYRLLESKSMHFNWLHPSTNVFKLKYYKYLIVMMIVMLVVFLFAWYVMEIHWPQFESRILLLSMLFPFYIAIAYYELRETFYQEMDKMARTVSRYMINPSLALRGLLLVILFVINLSAVKNHRSGISPQGGWFMMLTQFAWVEIIFISCFFLRNRNGLSFEEQSSVTRKKLPRSYSLAIVTGILMVSIIPAISIFWLFFKQEVDSNYYSDQLTFAKAIDQRSQEINDRIKEFKYDPGDTGIIQALKLNNGVYEINDDTISNQSRPQAREILTTEGNSRFHDIFFPDNELEISFAGGDECAADHTWGYFYDTTDQSRQPYLMYRNKLNQNANDKTSFSIKGPSNDHPNTAHLFLAETFLIEKSRLRFFLLYALGIIGTIVLTYFLIQSLANRVFLIDLQKYIPRIDPSVSEKLEGIKASGIREEVAIPKKTTTDKVFESSVARIEMKNYIGNTIQIEKLFQDEKEFNFMNLIRWFLHQKEDTAQEIKWPPQQNKKKEEFMELSSDVSKITLTKIDPIQETKNRNRVQFKRFCSDVSALDLKKVYAFEKNIPAEYYEVVINRTLKVMTPFYHRIWGDLSDNEKYILYDFAVDGFANYKTSKTLWQLIDKGILVFKDLTLTTMTISFQEYVLHQKTDQAISDRIKVASNESLWKKIKIPLLIFLGLVGIFIYFTQESIYEKISGLFASSGSILSLILSNLKGDKEK